jgi:predicted lipoprotein with Yx(FWY)xxD motif
MESQSANARTRTLARPVVAAVLVVLGALALAACGGGGGYGGGGMSSKSTAAAPPKTASSTSVSTAHSARLGRSVLVAGGHTLYALSAETGGRFVCTDKACLALWSPLTVASGQTPQGSVALGTVARPDGIMQVTFHGQPLYTFAQDTSPGQSRGEGFRDVGTWHAVTTGAAAPKPAAPAPKPASPPAMTGGSGGYGSGGY